MKCEKIEKCPFFNEKLANMPSLTSVLKQRYCLENKEACARYMLVTADIEVPPTVFPQDVDRAKAIIATH